MCCFAQFLQGGIFSSCQKNEPLADVNTYTADNIEKNIQDLKASVVDNKKSGLDNKIDFNDALYLLEASFNYYYGFSTIDFQQFITDTVIIPLDSYNLTDFTKNSLLTLYKAINNSIVEQFENCQLPNKHVFCVDLITEATMEGTNLLILSTIVNKITTNKSGTIGNDVMFGSTDYWNLTITGNKCNGYQSSQFNGINATDKLQEKANLNKKRPTNGKFWGRVETIGEIWPRHYPNTFTTDAAPNYKQFLLPYRYNDFEYPTPNFNTCLTPNEMNFHYNGVMYIIGDRSPSSEAKFIGCTIELIIGYFWSATEYNAVITQIRYGYPLTAVDYNPDFPSSLN